MVRKPGKRPPHRKPPSIRQRLQAQSKCSPSSGGPGGRSPRHKPDPDIDRAHVAWGQHRYDLAIHHYERALARDPHNAVLLVDVARAYALRYRFGDAERLIDLAKRLYPSDVDLQRMLGRSFVQIQQYDRAIVCFRRALDLQPTSPERAKTLLELARIYERLHDLDAARVCAEESLALAPESETACFALATIERRAGQRESAEVRWRQIIERHRAPPGILADAWYQLALLDDAAGNYADAWNSAVQAKQQLEGLAASQKYDASRIKQVRRQTFEAITAEHCERWQAAGQALEPLPGGLALLVSHPRSGTTLLEQVLDSHPKLISADELQIMSELVYVPLGRGAPAGATVVETLDQAPPDQLNRLRQDYWTAMQGALRETVGERILLDKNPELTMLLPMIARVFPTMKVLFALRDPRDVVISCFFQRLPLNAVSVSFLSLAETVKKYTSTMRAWLRIRHMLRNPWREVRYEDAVADLEGTARSVLHFLDLPWDPCVLDYHHRAQRKHVHSPTYEAVTRPVYTSSIGRWRNYASQIEPYLDSLQPYVDEFGYR